MHPVCLAIDVTGGDYGASVMVQGVLEALRHSSLSFRAILCGDPKLIAAELRRNGLRSLPKDGALSIEPCTQSIGEGTAASRVWKQKPRSSTVRCISLQEEGQANASVSAGDTGILMAAAVFILGRQTGVSRPALAALMPSVQGGRTLLLDVGANLNCRAEHLVSFAHLGREYMVRHRQMQAPRIALLNVGRERAKGTPAIVDADAVLRRSLSGYGGYIEGSQILAGDADVIVCDGFAGNVLLKACESFYVTTKLVLGADKSLLEALRKGMSFFNAESYGAVPFLGVNGVVLKAHGGSTAGAIRNAVAAAVGVALSGATGAQTSSEAMKGHHRTNAVQILKDPVGGNKRSR